MTTIHKACDLIMSGQVVAFPTETVYGLGADATNDSAVARIFELKNRPTFNPLIIHYASMEAAQSGVEFNEQALALAQAFWPGPLTLVLPRKLSANISLLASAGLDTIGVRVPAHEVALAFLEKVGKPIAAPSANRSGSISPTCIEHVKKSFADMDLAILDGNHCRIGLESTILDLSGEMPLLLRPGGITTEALQKHIGPMAQRADTLRPRSPGQSLSHYAPSIPVRLRATHVRPTEAFLGFGKCEHHGGTALLNLSLRGDLVEAAANLFAMLHELDTPQHEGIAIAAIPDHGLGLAINDRLQRAAGERPLR